MIRTGKQLYAAATKTLHDPRASEQEVRRMIRRCRWAGKRWLARQLEKKLAKLKRSRQILKGGDPDRGIR